MPRRDDPGDELMQLMQLIQQQMLAGDSLPDPAELLSEIAELPQRPDIHWVGFIEPLEIPGMPLPPGVSPHLAVMIRPESPEASLSELAESREEAEVMLLGAILEPDDDVDIYRPGTLFVPDVQQAFTLSNLLRGAGIRVEVEPTGNLQLVRQQLVGQFLQEASEQQASMQPQPLFEGLSDEQVSDFVQAFRRFMQAGAWRILPPDKPLFARWNAEEGQPRSLYATVMGDMGESFGVAFFGDWLAYAEQINNSFDQELTVRGLDGMEAVTEGQEQEFTSDDWARLRGLGLLAGRQKTAPVLQRLGLEGTMPPRTPVPVVTAILNVLAERAGKKASGRVTSLRGRWQGVEVHFPGKPRDELRPEELTGTVTLSLTGGRWLEEDEVFRLTGPSGELISKMRADIARQLAAAGKKMRRLESLVPLRITRPILDMELAPGDLFREDFRVWEQGLGTPPITLAQLTRREGLESFGVKVAVDFSPEPTEGFSWSLTKE